MAITCWNFNAESGRPVKPQRPTKLLSSRAADPVGGAAARRRWAGAGASARPGLPPPRVAGAPAASAEWRCPAPRRPPNHRAAPWRCQGLVHLFEISRALAERLHAARYDFGKRARLQRIATRDRFAPLAARPGGVLAVGAARAGLRRAGFSFDQTHGFLSFIFNRRLSPPRRHARLPAVGRGWGIEMEKGLSGAAGVAYNHHNPPTLHHWPTRCQCGKFTNFLPVGN